MCSLLLSGWSINLASRCMQEAEELLEQCYLMCFTNMTVGRPVARSQMAVEMTMR